MPKTLDRTAAHHDHPIDTRLKISALWTAMLHPETHGDPHV
jgi:hypothetical protein